MALYLSVCSSSRVRALVMMRLMSRTEVISFLSMASLRGQRRPADGSKIQIHHQMIRRAQGGSDLPSPLHLYRMPLSVGHREEKKLVAIPLGDGRRDGRVQPSAR